MTIQSFICCIRIHDGAPRYTIEVLGYDYELPVKIIKPHEPIPPPLPKAILTKTSGVLHYCVGRFEEHERELAAHSYWALGEDVQEMTDD